MGFGGPKEGSSLCPSNGLVVKGDRWFEVRCEARDRRLRRLLQLWPVTHSVSLALQTTRPKALVVLGKPVLVVLDDVVVLRVAVEVMVEVDEEEVVVVEVEDE